MEDEVEVRGVNETSADTRARKLKRTASEDDIVTELGIWLSGLESFLAAVHHSFADSRDAKALPDSSKEFRLVHSTLQRCSMLNARLLSANGAAEASLTSEIKFGELAGLGSVLRDATLLSEGLIHSNSLGAGEWKAWCGLLSHRFRALPVFSKLIHFSQEAGAKYLPGPPSD